MKIIVILLILLFPIASFAETQICVKSVKTHREFLHIKKSVVKPYTCRFTVTEDSLLTVSGHIDSAHIGDGVGRIIVGFHIEVNGKKVMGSNVGENILHYAHHYLSLPIHGIVILSPGDYVVKILGRSSNMTRSRGSVAKIKPDHNKVVYRIEPRDGIKILD